MDDSNEITTVVTVCVVTVIAVLTERRGFVSGVVISIDALTAVGAENGHFLGTALA